MSEPEIHTQQQRENPEPEEGTNPMPWFVILLTAVLFAFGDDARVYPGHGPDTTIGRERRTNPFLT